jgi:hypothetical protein
MHIAKLRDETGLVPAGRYFEHLAKILGGANARERTRGGDADDRRRDPNCIRDPIRHVRAERARP